MSNYFPDNISTALKEAVINVFWKKQDVRALFERCGVGASLISAQRRVSTSLRPVFTEFSEYFHLS